MLSNEPLASSTQNRETRGGERKSPSSGDERYSAPRIKQFWVSRIAGMLVHWINRLPDLAESLTSQACSERFGH